MQLNMGESHSTTVCRVEDLQASRLRIQLTCKGCGSGNEVYAPAINQLERQFLNCHVCSEPMNLTFLPSHSNGCLKDCISCGRKDFYQQKDFNRKVGVIIFIIAAILSIFTYGLSFIVFYLIDFLLFKKLSSIAVCYYCNAIYRNVKNIDEILEFNHEMNDRILYSGHDFGGKGQKH